MDTNFIYKTKALTNMPNTKTFTLGEVELGVIFCSIYNFPFLQSFQQSARYYLGGGENCE